MYILWSSPHLYTPTPSLGFIDQRNCNGRNVEIALGLGVNLNGWIVTYMIDDLFALALHRCSFFVVVVVGAYMYITPKFQ